MHHVFITGIVFSGIILCLLIVAGTFLMIFRMRQTSSLSRDGESQDREAAMIQEIYAGLSRMEQRVEALETILMEYKKEERL